MTLNLYNYIGGQCYEKEHSEKIIAVFLSILIEVIATILPINALTFEKTVPTITSDLQTELKTLSTTAQLDIYIWYKDIDHEEVEEQTYKKTGISPSELNVEISGEKTLLELKALENLTEKQAVDRYMQLTQPQRELEKANTDEFIETKRELSRVEYNKKSTSILSSNNVAEKDIIFESEYAPMVIMKAELQTINKLKSDSNIESIGIFEEPDEENNQLEIDEYIQQSTATNLTQAERIRQTMGFNKVYTELGLTGNGVKVGMLEWKNPSNTAKELDMSRVHYVGTPIILGDHAENTAKIIAGDNMGLSKNVEIYSTVRDYYNTTTTFSNLEILLSHDIKILNVSTMIHHTDLTEEWMEHIISQHNVTLVASAGNDSYVNVLLPALLHNAIGVGTFHNNNDVNNSNDVMRGSLYPDDKNGSSYINTNGVKKTDVILPNNIGGGATSSSAPVLTAMIAQLIELKPSLAIHPELIKSIVMASSHRKVLPSPVNEPQEYITDGITERQGAGVPDLWTMVCIVTQGTYSLGTLQERDSKINIYQPSYDAEYMNVSVSWLKDNKFDSIYNQVSAAHNINIGEVTNIDLYVSNSNNQLASSTLANSSTEMCYFSLSDNSSFYTIELRQPPEKINVDYAVAWSTDDMYVTDMDTDGIYMIRNFTDDSLLKYNETSNSVSLEQNSSDTQLDSSYMWLYKDNGNNNIDLVVGNSTTDKYIINAGGPVMITNSSSGLTQYYNSDYNNGYSFSSGSLYLQKNSISALFSSGTNDNIYWYLDRVNYQKGDLDMNGTISIADSITLQQILSRIISGNQIQNYLGDINNNGVIDIGDAILISQILSRY